MTNIRNIQTFMKRSLLAVAFVGTAITAWAQDPTSVAKIGGTEYATLQAAINAAEADATIELIADINETATYTIDKTITIDFGERTITASHTNSSALSNTDIVFDITASGNLTATGTTGGVTDATVLGIFNNAGTLTINGGHYTTNTDDFGVVYNNGGTCTIAGGTITGAYAAVYNRTGSVTVNGGTLSGVAIGINAKTGTTVNITNGNVSSPSIAVYGEASSTITISGGNITAPHSDDTEATQTSVYLEGSNAKAEISGGTINAKWGVQVTKGGVLSLTAGSITATANGVDVREEGSTATISGGTINAANGVLITDQATLTVNAGASITGTNTAISGNGGEGKGNTTITISGGTMTTGENVNGVGIYHPQNGTLTIVGGTITGNTAVEVRSGTVSITGGTLTANAAEYSCNSNGNGSTTVGAALAIAQHTTKKDITVNISGGAFTGVKAISESNPENNDPAPQVTMSVTAGDFKGGITVEDVQNGFIEGGTFSEAFPAEYCVDGKAPYVDENGACTIITPATEVPTDAEALSSNGSYYKVLNGAITAAGNTATTINVLKNPAAEAITIPAGASIILAVANDVELTKPITNNGTLSMAGTISGAITIAAFDATVKIASGVTLPTVALSTELQNENVLKSSTTKESGYTSYWVEKKVKAMVDAAITGDGNIAAATTLAQNNAISNVSGLSNNQSLIITVKEVTLSGTDVKKATFEVKLIGADGEAITNELTTAVGFNLPILFSTALNNPWVNLWHDGAAIAGTNNIQGSGNGQYIALSSNKFSPFSYEIVENPIAQIGETKYETVADAITAAATTETEIKLLRDVDAQTAISVSSGQNVKLTIGTHTVSDNITNAGTLTLWDGTNGGGTNGVISGTITNTGTLIISDKANVSGAITATDGTVKILGGIIHLGNTPNNAITTSNNAGLVISGGTIDHDITVGGSGTNTISGGTISGIVSVNTATLNISGGTFSNTITATGTDDSHKGIINISGGTFTGTISEDTNGNGDVQISGGTHSNCPVVDLCATGYIPLVNEGATTYGMTNTWPVVDDTDLSANPHFANASTYGVYSVATATYTRNSGMVSAGNAATKYGTICLPFEITAQPSGMTLYKATSINGSTLNITMVDFSNSATVPAGTPLIFELTAAAKTLTVTSGNATVDTKDLVAPTDGNLLIGTYSGETINTGLENIYYLNGDAFHQAVTSLTVPKFRAYLYYETPSSSAPMPNVLYISSESNAETGLTETFDMESVTEVFDLNGRKQSGLQKGMNIVRRADGSSFKVIVK